jgi:hypothetical protein
MKRDLPSPERRDSLECKLANYRATMAASPGIEWVRIQIALLERQLADLDQHIEPPKE